MNETTTGKLGLDGERAVALRELLKSLGSTARLYKTHDVQGPYGVSEARYVVECDGQTFESLVGGLAYAAALAENEWDKLVAAEQAGLPTPYGEIGR